MKKEVTLQFTSSESLWKFWELLSFKPSRVSFQAKTITQCLTEEELQLALTKFQAQISEKSNVTS